MLEDPSELCVAIGLAQGDECEISLDPDTRLVERFSQHVLGLGLRHKQRIVVFAADPLEFEVENALAVAVNAEREPTVSELHERRCQAALFEEFKCSCLHSDCA